MQDRYDDSPAPGDTANTMEVDELLGYLQDVDNFDLSPWMGILTQTEAMGDPAMPSKEQSAILLWLGKSLEQWENQFPLEEPLATQVKRIKPLAAAQAIIDPTFLQPGAHPIHKLLDAIQGRAVGWQSQLDRVGAILEQQVTKAIEGSRRWFEDRNLDLDDICSEFVAAAERDSARARRMIQRVVETELGKVKTAAAKIEAARMINALLEEYQAPAEIGEFLKGPWYSSAQLVLLKFSQDSEQWQQMSETTKTLLDSLQPMDNNDEDRKQHIVEVVTRLPKEMRRWLLSLHHDTEAVNEAMGLVEFAHLRILRNQALEIEKVEPLAIMNDPALSGAEQNSGTRVDFAEGQWFFMDTPEQGEVRVQLVLKVDREEQLLFTNMAGIKVMQMSFTEFSELLATGKVAALEHGASFSRCLAQAAGIKSTAMLDALAKTQGAPENWRDANKTEETPVPRKPELELVSSHSPPPAGTEEPSAAGEKDLRAVPGASVAVEPDQNSNVAEPATSETDLASEATIDINASETDERAFLDMLDDELLDDFGQEVSEEPGAQTGPATAEVREDVRHAELTETVDSAPDAEFLSATGASPAAGADPGRENEMTSADKPMAAAGEGFLLDQSQQLANPAPEAEESSPSPEEPTREIPDTPPASTEPGTLELPSGTWLGFHDGEAPLMARLAVHDPDDDQYIFVNRQGVKLRTTSGAELASLIDQGLVDILETKNNFRDEVRKARDELDS